MDGDAIMAVQSPNPLYQSQQNPPAPHAFLYPSFYCFHIVFPSSLFPLKPGADLPINPVSRRKMEGRDGHPALIVYERDKNIARQIITYTVIKCQFCQNVGCGDYKNNLRLYLTVLFPGHILYSTLYSYVSQKRPRRIQDDSVV